jgi:hypothetical protein
MREPQSSVKQNHQNSAAELFGWNNIFMLCCCHDFTIISRRREFFVCAHVRDIHSFMATRSFENAFMCNILIVRWKSFLLSRKRKLVAPKRKIGRFHLPCASARVFIYFIVVSLCMMRPLAHAQKRRQSENLERQACIDFVYPCAHHQRVLRRTKWGLEENDAEKFKTFACVCIYYTWFESHLMS